MKRIILAAALAVSLSAQAEYFSGNDLLSRLQSTSIVDKSTALGYIAGVADLAQGSIVCIPAGVTAGQAADLVKAALEAAPAVRHNTADQLVVQVLKSAWPCASNSKNNSNRNNT